VTAVATTIPVRIRVQDAWNEVALDLPPDTTVRELKLRALESFRNRNDPDGYVVKFRGAELIDEGHTLTDADIVANAALIVLPRRRRPVR
jgi:hypothetical protein